MTYSRPPRMPLQVLWLLQPPVPPQVLPLPQVPLSARQPHRGDSQYHSAMGQSRMTGALSPSNGTGFPLFWTQG